MINNNRENEENNIHSPHDSIYSIACAMGIITNQLPIDEGGYF